jgi:hypothetical protein
MRFMVADHAKELSRCEHVYCGVYVCADVQCVTLCSMKRVPSVRVHHGDDDVPDAIAYTS